MKTCFLTLGLLMLSGCASMPPDPSPFGTRSVPAASPIVFMPELAAEGLLIHGGCFSPDLQEFLFSVSDAAFKRFDVRVIRRLKGGWSEPEDAFFNSTASEHGTSYSPDGSTLYFCSTRQLTQADTNSTWQIWRCLRQAGGWSAPAHVDIPNLQGKLVSHPSVAADGTLYFHAGSRDYSELHLYSSKPDGLGFESAIRLPLQVNQIQQQVTPYIDPEQRFLIYAQPGRLMLSQRDQTGAWSQAVPLGEDSPVPSQGNPYVTPDGRFLFFAAGEDPGSAEFSAWQIYWLRTDGLGLLAPGNAPRR